MELRLEARAILVAGLQSVEPGGAVRRAVASDPALAPLRPGTGIERYRRVILVGAGKAAVPMATAVETLLGDRLDGGCIVAPAGSGGHRDPSRVRVVRGSHPLPDADAVLGASEILSLAHGAGEDDLVIVVLSGGGSALLPLPVEGVTLEDLQTTTQLLLRAGVAIDDLNAVRKHLSRIQGGWLAAAAAPATIVTLVLSDVVGNRLDVIAGGPTAPDPTTFGDALAVIDRAGAGIPAAVRAALLRGLAGQARETPKADDPAFTRALARVVADNRSALLAMEAHARSLGFEVTLLDTPVQGDAREAGTVIGRMLSRLPGASGRPGCLLFGGETTVTVRGDGRGGRNQELAIAAAMELATAPGTGTRVLLTAGTDGIDGSSDAAGGLVDGQSRARASALGLDPVVALDRNDSTAFLAAIGDLVVTGPTGTNVADVGVGLSTG